MVTCGREAYQLAYQLSSGVVERLTDLDSSQEEADTRLLLHAAHASRSQFVDVTIASEDTDVHQMQFHVHQMQFPDKSKVLRCFKDG